MERKIKLAVCLFGNLGNRQCAGARDPNVDLMKESDTFMDVRIPYTYLSQALTSHYETDFFIHSWSKKYDGFIKELYKPKASQIEEQKPFEVNLEEYGIIGNDIDQWKVSDSSKFGYKALLPSRGSVDAIVYEMKRMAFRSSSRYYSTKQSIELKKDYELKNNIKYDFVLSTRFDIMFGKRIVLEDLDKYMTLLKLYDRADILNDIV